MTRPARVLFVAPEQGLGEGHTAIALALALRDAGHAPVVAASPSLAHVATQAGLEAVAVGVDYPRTDPSYWDTVFETLLDVHRGPRRFRQELIAPSAATWLTACAPLAAHADLIVAGSLVTFASQLSAVSRTPWVHVLRSPALSSDTPELLVRLLALAKPSQHAAIGPLHAALSAWSTQRFERASTIGPAPLATFAAFSAALQGPTPAGSTRVEPRGATSFDGAGEAAHIDAELEQFLARGPAPVLLTLGTGRAVFRPGSTYDAFAEATSRIDGQRAVLLVGAREAATLRPRFSNTRTFVAGYAPYRQLMPRCRLVVHQGGAGATEAALASGVPSIVVGHAAYQRAHAARIEALGVGLSLAPAALTSETLERDLRRVLDDGALHEQARALAVPTRAQAPEPVFVDQTVELLARVSGVSRQRASSDTDAVVREGPRSSPASL